MVIAQILNFRSKFDNFIYYWSISVSTGLKLSLAGSCGVHENCCCTFLLDHTL